MPTDVQTPLSEAKIFARVWEGDSGRLSAAAARVILKIGFHDEDVTRIRELARKNSEGSISAGELTEYDNYVKVADLLAILQSKARQVLKRKPVTRARRG
jgi:hypothetical protein